MSHESILLRVSRYCRSHNLTEREFGRMITGDANLLPRCRADGGVRDSTWDKIEKYLEDHGG